MHVERPLPKLRRSRAVIILVVFLALSVASVAWSLISDWSRPLWLIGAGVVAMLIAFYYRRRCPQWGQYLIFRAEPLPSQSYRHRILFDCTHCDITWD
jgi:4-hydroxybenzoate polyprenyltransferase